MIEVKASSIIIHNYTLGDCGKLERLLSYWDQAYHKYMWSAFTYYEDEHKLILPGGFDIDYLQYLFPNKEVKFTIKRDASMFLNYKMNAKPRDEIQYDCIDFILGKGKYSHLKNETQKMICMDTGTGKSYSTVNAISQYRKKAIIFVDQAKLMDQWKYENFLKFTNLQEKDIYCIAGASTIEKIMKKDTDTPYKIFLASYKTISNYAKRHGWYAVGEFLKKIKVGMKVYDEAHTDMKNFLLIDAHSNTSLTLYLTASPGRSDPKEDKIYRSCFKKIPVFGLREQQSNKYHNVILVNYNSNPSEYDEAYCNNKYGFNINAYYDLIFNKEKKFAIFLTVMKKLLDLVIKKKGKIAILVHNIAHVEMLQEYLQELYPDVSIGLFYSKISKDKLPEELSKKIIISTDKSLGKAIDIKGLKFFISTIPTSSEIVTHQMLGRLRRIPGEEVIFFDLCDVGYRACKSQQRKRSSFFRKKAKSIKILNL